MEHVSRHTWDVLEYWLLRQPPAPFSPLIAWAIEDGWLQWAVNYMQVVDERFPRELENKTEWKMFH